MENCIQCKPTNDRHTTIGKTYYILPDHTLMCYRHWWQAREPEYLFKGEYQETLNKLHEFKIRRPRPTAAH
jgi:hypothetical protein